MIGRTPGSTRTDTLLPYTTLFRSKSREGDRSVRVSLPDPIAARGRTPVVVDDIVSSGHTMIETLKHLAALGLPPATCMVTHAVFSEDAYDRLLAAGAQRVVSTDTIPHPDCNAIAMAPALAVACEALRSEERRVGKEWGSTGRSRGG